MAIKKQTFFQILFVSLIIAVILFMFWMISWLKGESSQCVANPLSYYAEKTDQLCDPNVFYYDVACVPISTNVGLPNLTLTFPQSEE